MIGWCALAGAARATAPARPRSVPARTAVVRWSGDFKGFTPTPVKGIRGSGAGKAAAPPTGARPATTPPRVVESTVIVVDTAPDHSQFGEVGQCLSAA